MASYHFTAESDCPSSAPSVPIRKVADLIRKVTVQTANSTTSELCPLCGLTLGSELCFNLHINLDTSTGYVLYECRICKRNSTHRRQMRTHLRVHTGEKPFSCPHCPHRAAQRASLKQHIERHEKGDPFCTKIICAFQGRWWWKKDSNGFIIIVLFSSLTRKCSCETKFDSEGPTVVKIATDNHRYRNYAHYEVYMGVVFSFMR